MLLICMSIAGTVPLIICLLLLLLQRKKFSYRLGRNLVFLSLVGYLIPFQVVKYLMPEDLLRETDSLMNIPTLSILMTKKQFLTTEFHSGCPTGFLWLDYAGCFL